MFGPNPRRRWRAVINTRWGETNYGDVFSSARHGSRAVGLLADSTRSFFYYKVLRWRWGEGEASISVSRASSRLPQESAVSAGNDQFRVINLSRKRAVTLPGTPAVFR
ncbi:hypothetical protein ElyMa_001901900 [Elysia marginata]|uniref:Uncharacterized protein n=1 Tax=Elysia marginata TaxID=1093978 RepID=A0AAV4ERD2_9GAST|nr:hypothetical protein ElyMa_001901900 [Elysia marginata]